MKLTAFTVNARKEGKIRFLAFEFFADGGKPGKHELPVNAAFARCRGVVFHAGGGDDDDERYFPFGCEKGFLIFYV